MPLWAAPSAIAEAAGSEPSVDGSPNVDANVIEADAPHLESGIHGNIAALVECDNVTVDFRTVGGRERQRLCVWTARC